MNVCSVNKINFGAKIQFENNNTKVSFKPRKRNLLEQASKECFVGYQAVKNIITGKISISAVLSKIIKVKHSIKLPS